MTMLDVDGLSFTFPDDWDVSKFDDWAFCKRFQNIVPKTGAVDLMAISPAYDDGTPITLWLIEVKDYRQHLRENPSTLDVVIAEKVRGTLAALLPAKLDAHDAGHRRVAGKALNSKRIRILLHLEQPAVRSAYVPNRSAINRANVLADLKTRVRSIDPHPRIVDRTTPDLPWTVTP
ncbi:hypothetical protein [Deinococcus daejeonensis]|uniref:Cysteinyl-tRNA synthetase n=1 Tax=Deinococcus daejeonensis TaxID=1007098 RepID=A0ABQ2JIR8_9DEIO|nr:hypothetical protein [Deinococcus daejeonensis]GGN46070.1 hypothetical protein GCM10010842_36270 [Deinococcus daejeonensis]